MTSPTIPKVITHKNMGPLLGALAQEPCFQCGSNIPEPEGAWFRRQVILEFPLGELYRDGLLTLALTGFDRPETLALTGKEGFNAQGLEGKVQVRKDLFLALMNLRDLLPEFRGRIITKEA